ncbi:J domain-containing protein [Polaromonas eurypsychrophila]|uniref:Curved DNA-binding protein n=1 Tax=Polaromonas eurypsychrophila TaxID=1614635 RepID=A0A916SHK1_9BURK|nr:J domain-containing protein [Polaromonas eurypsychrophila]GGA96603.1 curved DNA-binding protein [Polaromonas eurypsychrophila]
MKYKDYYLTLGVPRDANLDQIKKAYRKLARQHHPDLSKASDAEAHFKEAAEAYSTLKDPEKRAAYDELGRRPPGEEFAPPPQWRDTHASGGQSFDEMDLADILAALNRGQRGAQHGSQPLAGRDYDTTTRISLEEAHRGTVLSLYLGEGPDQIVLEVTIPPGVREGQKLRLRGKGGKGRNGGADGDIYLHITLAPHPVFRADDHDLYFDLLLAPWEAALGADVEVPTLDGPLLLTVPPGTRSARKLRVRGRGMSKGHSVRGDLYAVVQIDVPATLSERERELFSELARSSRFNPRAITKESVHETPAS